jgi:hypothetical protein
MLAFTEFDRGDGTAGMLLGTGGGPDRINWLDGWEYDGEMLPKLIA